MYKATDAEAAKTEKIMNDAFIKRMGGTGDYTLVYGYYIKSRPFGPKITTYVIGFSLGKEEIVIIPLDNKANPGAAITIDKKSLTYAGSSSKGEYIIQSPLIKEDEIRFFIKSFTPSSLNKMGILPVNQDGEASIFKEFMSNFN